MGAFGSGVQGFRRKKSGELCVFLPALELHEEALFDLFGVERFEAVHGDPYQPGPAFGIVQNGVLRGLYPFQFGPFIEGR